MASLGITDATSSVFKGNNFAQFAAATVAGGTASRLLGGSFANGAQTAAYGYLFNELMHSGGGTAHERMARAGYGATVYHDGQNGNIGTICNPFCWSDAPLEGSHPEMLLATGPVALLSKLDVVLIAGYRVMGSATVIDGVYVVDVFGVVATKSAQGLTALGTDLMAAARASGATSIEFTGQAMW